MPFKRFYIILFLLSSNALAFNIPERLEYDLRWTGLKAGTSILEIKKDGDKIMISSTATSAKWVSVFYHVEDKIESILNPILPISYRIKLKEGKHKRDKEVIFNHADKKVIYIDHLKKERQEFDTLEKLFDPLSGFYHLRNMNLKVGESVYLPVFDSKKIWSIEVKVLRKEELKTPSGTFNTIVIKPLMRSEGIFSRKGDIYIWLTDDEKKIPVQLKSKVVVGYITAILVGAKY